MNWKEFCILTEKRCSEAVAGMFHHLGCGGVVIIEDPKMIGNISNLTNAESITQSKPNQEYVIIKAYFSEERDITNELYAYLDRMKEIFNSDCTIVTGRVQDEDWAESWKQYYHTAKIGKRLIIKPSWEEYEGNPDDIVIELDPGMAFGTGEHASTRFCLEFVDRYIKGGEFIIDAGCGSGILSIAAAKLGAEQILAYDIDEVAVKVAQENIYRNNVQEVITVATGNAIEKLRGKKADIIMANILAEVIMPLIPEAVKTLGTGGKLFVSGIINQYWPEILQQLESNNFFIDEVLREGEWVGAVVHKN